MSLQNIAAAAARPVAKAQKGFTVVEFMAVLFLTILAGILAWPRITGLYVEIRVPFVADDLKAYVARTKSVTQGYGIAPYAGLTQLAFARAVKDTNLKVGDVSGEGTTSEKVRHGLGGADNGTINFTESGSFFTLTLTNVSQYACPTFLSSVEMFASSVSVNGVVIKKMDDSGNLTTAYSAAKASAQCKDGDTNEYILTVN